MAMGCPWSTYDACKAELDKTKAELEAARADLAKINTPEVNDFLKAVELEAKHQRLRWGTSHDGGKTDADWFWLIGYLAGKALHNPDVPEVPEAGGMERGMHPEIDLFLNLRDERAKKVLDKQLHRIITVAAAALNWHAAKLGIYTDMRPGIEEPK